MKYLRLKKKKDITKVLKAGKRLHSNSLTVVYFPSAKTSMAVCVGKKFGKSVRRNHIKRLLREAFSCYSLNITPSGSFLLIPKEATEYSFFIFKKDMGKLLKKEKLIETEN